MLVPIVVAIVLIGLTYRAIFVTNVRGASMSPTFHDGDRLLTIRRSLFRSLRPGDIVVCQLPTGYSLPDGGSRPLVVKRVAATAGQPQPNAQGSGRVPAGHIFVVGDSPQYSFDSSDFGPIPQEHVVGVVVRRLMISQSR
jgi:signal peptidase I